MLQPDVVGAPSPWISVPQKHCVANSRPASGKLLAWQADRQAGTVISPSTPIGVERVRSFTSSLKRTPRQFIRCFNKTSRHTYKILTSPILRSWVLLLAQEEGCHRRRKDLDGWVLRRIRMHLQCMPCCSPKVKHLYRCLV